MAPAMANALSVILCIFTPFRHEPVVVFLPQQCSEVLPDAINLYIAYNSAGVGHYDGVRRTKPQEKSPYTFCQEKRETVVLARRIAEVLSTSADAPACKLENVVRQNVTAKDARTLMGQERHTWHPSQLVKRDYSALQSTDIPSSKRFALDRQEKVQTEAWMKLECFAE